MQETTNYKLKKLELTDFADITELNSNADIVDAEMKKHNNDIETIKNSYVTSVNGKKGAVTIPIATKEQAETGTDNAVYMSPLRTKEAIQKFAPLKTVNNQKPDSNGNVNVKEYTHPLSGVNAGTYDSVTVDKNGHVTAGSNPSRVTSVNGKTGAVTIATYTHPNSGVAAGTYRKVTVNVQGHVTAGVAGAVPISDGGTGATNAKQALKNLGGVMSVNGVVANSNGDVTITIPKPPVTSVNGKTGDVTITIPKGVKDITISGKTITVTFDDDTKKTLTTQDTNTTYGVATQTANGLLSAADKKKLDNITGSESTVVVTSGTGTPDSIYFTFTIPLPSGYNRSQCKYAVWLTSHSSYSDDVFLTVNQSTGVVTAKKKTDDGSTTYGIGIGYICIAVK